MEEKKQIIKITDENGKDVEAEVLITFALEDTGKNYMVYTLNEEDGEGNVTIYTSIINEENGKVMLDTIESDEEWDRVKEVIRELSKDEEN